MNSWKELPNLFANGKFSAKYGKKTLPIIGLSDNTYLKTETDLCLVLKDGKLSIHRPINDCQLIARSISDMSDEELKTFFINEGMDTNKLKDEITTRRKWLIDELINNRYWKTFSGRLYLLNIGVLPSNFNDNDVIWRYKN